MHYGPHLITPGPTCSRAPKPPEGAFPESGSPETKRIGSGKYTLVDLKEGGEVIFFFSAREARQPTVRPTEPPPHMPPKQGSFDAPASQLLIKPSCPVLRNAQSFPQPARERASRTVAEEVKSPLDLADERLARMVFKAQRGQYLAHPDGLRAASSVWARAPGCRP
jgi:hypothetical protein